MNRVAMVALVVVLSGALAAPAAAKVNLRGALWATYWAQRQAGNVQYLVSDGANWVTDAQTAQTASAKTFLLGQNQSGNGLQAHNPRGNGFAIGVECPVNDELSAYAEFNGTGGALAASYAYVSVALPADMTLTAGLIDVPFGNEVAVRPGVACVDDAVFISEFTQQATAALLPATEIGVALAGTAGGDMVAYSLALLNGALPSAADSAGVTGWATPDNNDAKSVAVQVRVTPWSGAYVLGSYMAGDYNNAFVASPTRYTARGLAVGYAPLAALRLSAELATTSHDKLMYDFGMGVRAPAGELVAARVNEYVVKAIYATDHNWQVGVRYGVVDPKNIEAEVDAGYAREIKGSVALKYEFTECASLHLEYSRIWTNLSHYNKYDAVRLGAGATAVHANDPQDDIVAVQLSTYF